MGLRGHPGLFATAAWSSSRSAASHWAGGFAPNTGHQSRRSRTRGTAGSHHGQPLIAEEQRSIDSRNATTEGESRKSVE